MTPRSLQAVLLIILVCDCVCAQRRSPQDRMTPYERKKLERFADRDDPYRPAWMARTRFSTIETLKRCAALPVTSLEVTEEALREFRERFAVMQVAARGTLFIYDRATERLAAIAEYGRQGRRASLRRWVRYHPSFTEYTITDLETSDEGEPTHGATRTYLRTWFHATSKGEVVTGTGPFRMEATNNKGAWLRDGVLAQVLKLLNVPRGPTHDDHDRHPFGDDPYKPLWAEDIPFARLSRCDRRLPFKVESVRGTPLDETYEVKIAPERHTLLAFDKKTDLLAYVVETRANGDGTARSRCIAYHPSFSAYTVYDLSLDALRRPNLRITTRYERSEWKVSDKNRRKVEGKGPFVRKWQVAAGDADFGSVLWQLMAISAEQSERR